MTKRVSFNLFLLLAFIIFSFIINLLGYNQFKKHSKIHNKLFMATPQIKTLNTQAKIFLSSKGKSQVSPQAHLQALKQHPLFSKNKISPIELLEESKQTTLRVSQPIILTYLELESFLETLEGSEQQREKYSFPEVHFFEMKQSPGSSSLYTLNFELIYPPLEK